MSEAGPPDDFSDEARQGFEAGCVPTARDVASVMLGPLKLDLQLAAFRAVLNRSKTLDDGAAVEHDARAIAIHNAATVMSRDGWDALEHDIDSFNESQEWAIYQQAAHSLAAVGMLAPLFESLLVRMLKCALVLAEADGQALDHLRWQDAQSAYRGNCKRVFRNGAFSIEDNLMEGVRDFIGALPGDPLLDPQGFELLEVLFRYRNKVLHNGIEMPAKEARAFDNFLHEGLRTGQEREQAARRRWVYVARSGGRPWLFLLREVFWISCMQLMEDFVDEVGTRYLAINRRTGFAIDDLCRRVDSL